MITFTRARTETTVRVERTADGARVRVTTDARGGPDQPTIRPVIVESGPASATVSLVPEGALLLGGDDVRIAVQVGAGVTLRLIEPAGTVAYDMRGGAARWLVDIDIAAGGALTWLGEPFVAAAGSDTTWTATITLAPDARLWLRETLVLGRHGELPGRMRHHVEARVGGVAKLVDAIDVGPGTPAYVLGGHRVIGSTLMFGCDDPSVGGTRFELEGGGVLVRCLADEMHLL